MPIESHSDYWSKGPVVLLVLRLLLWEASAERARRRGTATVFPGSLGGRVMVAFLVIGLAWLILKRWDQEEGWILALAGGIQLFAALAWPSTIWLSDTGIEERRWWRPRKWIPWNEVTAIQANAAGDKAVFGRSGQYICLDRFHVDPVGFEYEVRRRANLRETLDASAPITLGLQDYPHIPVGLRGRHKKTRRERKLENNGGSSNA